LFFYITPFFLFCFKFRYSGFLSDLLYVFMQHTGKEKVKAKGSGCFLVFCGCEKQSAGCRVVWDQRGKAKLEKDTQG